jgi:predicted ester cyclase
LSKHESKIAVLIITLSVFAIIGYAVSKEGMTKAQLIAQIQKNWDEVWVNGNLDAVDEASNLFASSYTADAVIHRLQEPDMDPGGLKESFAWFRSQFSDTRVIVDDVIAEGDRMVIQYTMNFTVKGPGNVVRYTFQNQATGESQSVSFPVPIGTRLSSRGCGVLRLVDGKIAEEWGYSDSVAMLQQAGIAVKSEWLEQ